MYIVVSYTVYLAVSLAVTVWVARSLHRNGRVFLVDAFQGNAEMADSVNHLLVMGFYLVNVGYVALALRSNGEPVNTRQAIELVCSKLGMVLIVVGLLHFGNIYVFNRLRQRGKEAPKRYVRNAEVAGRILD